MIRRVFTCTWILCAALIAARAGLSAQATSAPASQVSNPESRIPDPGSKSTIDQYCVTCHNARLKTGDLALESLDVARRREQRRVWEKVVRKLRAGVMPPQGARRPDDATLQALIASLETSLDQRCGGAAEPGPAAAASAQPRRVRERDPGSAGARRRCGLAAAARRFGLRLRQHLRRARRVAVAAGALSRRRPRRISAARRRRSVDARRAATRIAFRRICRRTSTSTGCRSARSAACACATRFRSTASTSFQTKLYRTNLNIVRGLRVSERVRDRDRRPAGAPRHASAATTIWRRCSTSRPIPATPWSCACACACRVPAGPHEVTVAFIEQLAVKDTVRLQPFLRSSADNFDWAGRPHIQTFAVTGPFDADGAGDTPSRREIFTLPADAVAVQRERACADADPRPPGAPRLSAAGRRRPSCSRSSSSTTRRARRAAFEAGIQRGLQRILASPRFVFRVEQRSGRRRARARRTACQRRRAGVAAVVLPVEQHSGRRRC